jgi:hypothetical protein
MPKPVVAAATVTWGIGDTLSSVLDCTTTSAMFVIVPDNWTDARISFQASIDGIKFYDAVSGRSGDYEVVATPGTAIMIDLSWTGAVGYLRIRSGQRHNPVPQQQAVTMTVAMQ